MRGPLILVVAAVAFWSLGGVATGQCVHAPDTAQLTIQGFATVDFGQLRTDSAHDRVEFYGGVCLTGETAPWTLTADSVTIQGIHGTLSVTAAPAVLRLEGWQLDAASLEADRQSLTLRTVRLSGRGVTGTAASAAIDLAAASLSLRNPDLASAGVYVRGSVATLVAHGIDIVDPVMTSCGCPGVPLYDVSGRSAAITVDPLRIALERGRLRVGAMEVPLAPALTLDAASLAALTVPVHIAEVEADAAAGVLASGLGVTIGPVALAPGVTTTVGATGLDGAAPLAAVAGLDGTTSTDRFHVGLEGGGLRMTLTSDHPVTPWLDAGFDTRIYEPGARDSLREAVVRATAHGAAPWMGGTLSVTGFAAASSQLLTGTTVAGPRLGIDATGTASTVGGHARLRWRASLTAYPTQGASQWGVEVEPSFQDRWGPVVLRASYLARFSDGGSPFGTSLDRLEPVQRASFKATVAPPPSGPWTVDATFDGVYDVIGTSSVNAGVNTLRARASVARQLGAWSVAVHSDAQLAGIVAPDGVREASVEVGVTASSARTQFGARARYDLAPGPPALGLLEVNGAVPIELQDVELRPYLAIDLAPTVNGGWWPAISGHGLDVTFVTCCGALELGYRDQDGVWSISASVDLQRRIGAAGESAACATGAGGGGATQADLPQTCSVTGADASIMAGAARGPPP